MKYFRAGRREWRRGSCRNEIKFGRTVDYVYCIVCLSVFSPSLFHLLSSIFMLLDVSVAMSCHAMPCHAIHINQSSRVESSRVESPEHFSLFSLNSNIVPYQIEYSMYCTVVECTVVDSSSSSFLGWCVVTSCIGVWQVFSLSFLSFFLSLPLFLSFSSAAKE